MILHTTMHAVERCVMTNGARDVDTAYIFRDMAKAIILKVAILKVAILKVAIFKVAILKVAISLVKRLGSIPTLQIQPSKIPA